jgi:hypothetical protein
MALGVVKLIGCVEEPPSAVDSVCHPVRAGFKSVLLRSSPTKRILGAAGGSGQAMVVAGWGKTIPAGRMQPVLINVKIPAAHAAD